MGKCKGHLMRTYVFTIKYKKLFDDEWQTTNYILDAENIKSAINKTYEKHKDKKVMYIEHVYSEPITNPGVN
jgi:hypothetical protein